MKQLGRKLIVLLMLCTMILSSITVAYAAEKEKWTKQKDGTYTYQKGTTYPTGFVKDSKGNTYYFFKNDKKNRMASNEYVKGYYLAKSGIRNNKVTYKWTGSKTKGWKYVQSKDTSKFVTGWKKIDNKWYFFNSKGVTVKGLKIASNGSIWWANDDYVFNEIKLQYNKAYNITKDKTTKTHNATFNGITETWYSNWEPHSYSTVPGKSYRTSYSGKFHVADDGTIRDQDGFIVVATPTYQSEKYKIVMTSLGPGKVYDGSNASKIDIYTNWKK